MSTVFERHFICIMTRRREDGPREPLSCPTRNLLATLSRAILPSEGYGPHAALVTLVRSASPFVLDFWTNRDSEWAEPSINMLFNVDYVTESIALRTVEAIRMHIEFRVQPLRVTTPLADGALTLFRLLTRPVERSSAGDPFSSLILLSHHERLVRGAQLIDIGAVTWPDLIVLADDTETLSTAELIKLGYAQRHARALNSLFLCMEADPLLRRVLSDDTIIERPFFGTLAPHIVLGSYVLIKSELYHRWSSLSPFFC